MVCHHRNQVDLRVHEIRKTWLVCYENSATLDDGMYVVLQLSLILLNLTCNPFKEVSL